MRDFLFFAKMALYERRASTNFNKLDRANALSVDQLTQLNFERRRKLVAHCAEKIPFYQRKFLEYGFEPGDLKSDADWHNLPILEKDEIRAFAGEIVDPSFDLRKLPEATTGGTTGRPLKTYGDPRVHLASMSFRMLSWWGVKPSENAGYLYRSIPAGLSKVVKDVALLPTRRVYLSASRMSKTDMDDFAKKLQRIRPRYLVGYVGAIEIFANYCQDNCIKFPELKAIWTTASPLTANQRVRFDEIFGAPTYTQYGSCEFYWIAAECSERDMLHVGSDVRHVDIVDGHQAVPVGTLGDIVVTDLTNFSFPLLRYRLGDIGRLVKGGCKCGLPFPRMDYVHGRLSDALSLSDGTLIPGEYWTTIFDDFTNSIDSFQVKQYANLDIEISFVGSNDRAVAAAAEVLTRLHNNFGSKVNLTMKKVRKIEHNNGKMQIVIREIS